MQIVLILSREPNQGTRSNQGDGSCGSLIVITGGQAKAAKEAYLAGAMKSKGFICPEYKHQGECNN
jgi:hypothetical protein